VDREQIARRTRARTPFTSGYGICSVYVHLFALVICSMYVHLFALVMCSMHVNMHATDIYIYIYIYIYAYVCVCVYIYIYIYIIHIHVYTNMHADHIHTAPGSVTYA
jgi:hypothetical protein